MGTTGQAVSKAEKNLLRTSCKRATVQLCSNSRHLSSYSISTVAERWAPTRSISSNEGIGSAPHTSSRPSTSSCTCSARPPLRRHLVLHILVDHDRLRSPRPRRPTRPRNQKLLLLLLLQRQRRCRCRCRLVPLHHRLFLSRHELRGLHCHHGHRTHGRRRHLQRSRRRRLDRRDVLLRLHLRGGRRAVAGAGAGLEARRGRDGDDDGVDDENSGT